MLLLSPVAFSAQKGSCIYSGPSVEKAKADIHAGYEHWRDVVDKQNADAAAALYTNEAVVMPPDKSPVIGKAAIRDFYVGYVKGPKILSIIFAPQSVAVCGDHIIDASTANGEAEVNGKTVPFHSKNIIVWMRQKDGSLLISHDMWSAVKDLPPAK
jgi:ketosteroid isomerase-like protein